MIRRKFLIGSSLSLISANGLLSASSRSGRPISQAASPIFGSATQSARRRGLRGNLPGEGVRREHDAPAAARHWRRIGTGGMGSRYAIDAYRHPNHPARRRSRSPGEGLSTRRTWILPAPWVRAFGLSERARSRRVRAIVIRRKTAGRLPWLRRSFYSPVQVDTASAVGGAS